MMGHTLPPTHLKADLHRAARMGVHGDTMIAHLSPMEARLLQMLGGVGTRNPRTGLPQFYSDSANEHSRATTGGNMADHSRPGGQGTQGGASPGTGARGPLGAGDLPVHTNANGPAGIPTGQSDPAERGTGGVGSNYQGAVADYVHNYQDDPFSRAVNFFTGFGLQKPNINQPATYEHGLSHTGFNPAAQIAGLAGMAIPVPGASFLLSKAAGSIYDLAGGRPAIIGDASPGVPGNEIHDFSGASQPAAPNFGPGNGAPGNGALLPPVTGQGAPNAAVNQSSLPASGSTLPPTTASGLQNVSPAAYIQIPGPSPYGFQRAMWRY